MNGETPEELLLVLSADAPEHVWEELRRAHHVIHTVSPRVLAIEAPGHDGPRPEDIEGVVSVTKSDVPDDVAATLNDTERLWIAAWAMRRAPKQRVGDGEAWDAPGFLPPDPPPEYPAPQRGPNRGQVNRPESKRPPKEKPHGE